MLTPDECVEIISDKARELAALAKEMGVTLRINVVPLQPLAMGNTEHVVEAWPARHGPKITA